MVEPFSDAELDRRRAAFGAELANRDLDAALVYGANRTGSAVSWLTGWPVTREALLVVRADPADDVLLVSFYNHVPQAKALSRVPVRWTGPSAIRTALDLLPPGARVGVVGALPFDQYRMLAERVSTVEDLNGVHTSLRLIKSAEEIAVLRRAAALTDTGVAALAAGLRPGVDDYALLADVEHAYVSRGGGHAIHYLGVTGMDDPSVAVPAQWPTGRRVRRRDVVTCEISASAAPEYAGQLLRTFTVGAPPSALYRDLHAVAGAAFDAITARLWPGTPAAELVAAANVIEDNGFTVVDDVVHGYGGGYLPPVLRTPAQRHMAVPDLVLAAGMTLVVQPNVTTPDGRAGVQTGELMLVTEDGPERLHTYPLGLMETE